MTWADFAHKYPLLVWIFSFVTLAAICYSVVTIRHAILARYNLELAAQRTTQEEYLARLLNSVLDANATLQLDDPIHRNALAKVVAERIVVGGNE